MPIVVTCPSCGKNAQAPDSGAGKSARCGGCGQSMQIPWDAVAAPAKICTDCGIDVCGQKRTKDTAGRYYCQPCWTAKVQAGAATALSRQPAMAAAPAGHAVTLGDRFADRNFPPQPEPLPADDSDELQTLEECAGCGLSFPAGELALDADERMVCASCGGKEVDLAPLPLPPPAYSPPPIVQAAPVLPYQSPKPVGQPRRTSGSGGNHVATMVIGAVICVIGIVITAGTYLAAVSGGGGRYTIAWGAIVFGGWRFFRGLTGMIGDR
jgi:hypothetical protein